MRAIDMAMINNHAAVVTLLLERGSQGAPAVLAQAVQRGSVPIAAAALASSELTRVQVSNALAAAKKGNNPEILALIEKKLAAMPAAPLPAGVTVDRATLQSYVGSYRNEDAGVAISFALKGDQLTFVPPAGTGAMTLQRDLADQLSRRRTRGTGHQFRGTRRHDRAGRGRPEQHAAGVDPSGGVTGWRGCGPAAGPGSGARPRRRQSTASPPRGPRRATGPASAATTPPGTATDRERWSNGTSRPSRTSAGRPRSPASRTPAPWSGAIECSW